MELDIYPPAVAYSGVSEPLREKIKNPAYLPPTLGLGGCRIPVMKINRKSLVCAILPGMLVAAVGDYIVGVGAQGTDGKTRETWIQRHLRYIDLGWLNN